MRNTAKFAHLLGLGLFLGSIFTFAVASGVPAPGDVASLAVARRIISGGTSFVTLPALFVLVTSGSLLLWRDSSLTRHGWLRVMVIAAIVVVANALLAVTPAVRAATALAQEAVGTGRLSPAYSRAYAIESVAGTVNIVLTLVAMACGVWKFGSTREDQPS
jgi:hypothetical protein